MNNSMSVIRDALGDKQAVLADMIQRMAAVNKIGDDIKFLTEFKGGGLNLSRQSYEKIGNIITNTALQEHLWRIHVYNRDGALLSYVIRKDPDNLISGFQYDRRFSL